MIPFEIYDTTLRDGEQAPGAAMSAEKKLEIAIGLSALGVDTIEAGFAAASLADSQSIDSIARNCRGVRIAAFARTKLADIEAAATAVREAEHPRIIIVMPVSDLHIRCKLGLSREDALALLSQSIRDARKGCAEVEVITEDATRSDEPFLHAVAQTTLDAGAFALTIADTVGFATPEDIEDTFRGLFTAVPELADIMVGVHCHDDLGLATVNSLAGVRAGARQVHCTMNGIGERAGNASLEEIVVATRVRPDRYPYQCNIKTESLWPLSQLVAESTGFVVAPNKAIVGINVFSHGSGMHQDGILKSRETYEIFPPHLVGAPGRQLPITRHSGRKGLAARIAGLGIEVDEPRLQMLMHRLKGAGMNSSIVEDAALLSLLQQMPKH